MAQIKQTLEHVAKRIEAMRGKRNKPRGAYNTEEKIWSKVDIKSDDECWPWKSWKNEAGYGRIEISGKSYYAHRVIFNMANPGVIELNAPCNTKEYGFIMHKCDNPTCCNPSHLMVGNHADNMLDKKNKGRCPDFSGDKGPRCKLTLDQAREARRLRAEGARVASLAIMFGISLPSMKTLLAGKSYREE